MVLPHPEITEELREIVEIHNDFEKLVKNTSGAVKERSRMDPFQFRTNVFRFNKDKGGTLEQRIYRVTKRLGNAQPEFHMIERASLHDLERFREVTGGASERMNKQLVLAKILDVKRMFKTEADIFDREKILKIEKLLKEIR